MCYLQRYSKLYKACYLLVTCEGVPLMVEAQPVSSGAEAVLVALASSSFDRLVCRGGGGCYGGSSNPKSLIILPLKSQIPKFLTPQIPNP